MHTFVIEVRNLTVGVAWQVRLGLAPGILGARHLAQPRYCSSGLPVHSMAVFLAKQKDRNLVERIWQERRARCDCFHHVLQAVVFVSSRLQNLIDDN